MCQPIISTFRAPANGWAGRFAASMLHFSATVGSIDSNSAQRSQTTEELRAWLRKMSDAELVRFGRAAASLCKPQLNSNRPIRGVFVEQVREARAEWRRRFPEKVL